MSQERFTLFWHGPFSQWHPCKFEIHGLTYNCAEQYMMAQKARLFSDWDSERLIMEAKDPSVQKKLGRKVQGFNAREWDMVAKHMVYRGNWCKFTQNPDLKEKLFATDGTTLVEASPYDKIWGIGLTVDDPRALDRSTWRGTNWLGEVLTKLREDLMNNETSTRNSY